VGRKTKRVCYHLDDKGIRSLPQDEIVAILRGADDLIMSGERNLLCKILIGSRAQDVLKRELDRSPVHGFYRNLTLAEILARVDWVILEGYLRIEYDYRLPLLVYTPAGWAIERETYAVELLAGFDEKLTSGPPPYDMTYLKERDRGMILLLLDKVEQSGNTKYIPLLNDWARIDYRKVRERIGQVIASLSQASIEGI
jgi:hypothetical protein